MRAELTSGGSTAKSTSLIGVVVYAFAYVFGVEQRVRDIGELVVPFPVEHRGLQNFAGSHPLDSDDCDIASD
jgi:hypothetical protein